MKLSRSMMSVAFLLLAYGSSAHAETVWVEGKNYFLINPPRPTTVAPGKVEVAEVFSYGCPACNLFLPIMHKLKAALPPNAVLTYVPAAFNTGEDWPMFQKAYLTAQALGVADQTHDAMFAAVWGTGELAVTDRTTQRLKDPMPSIDDAARFYNRAAGVPVDKFLSVAKSFSIDSKIRTTEDAIVGYRVDRTPTLIVNGRYRLQPESAGGADQVVDLVKFLVAKESK